MINSNEKLNGFMDQFRKGFDNIPFAIIFLDLDGKIKYINKKAKKIFKENCNDIIEKKIVNIPYLSVIFEERIPTILEDLKKGDLFGPENLQVKIKNKIFLLNVYASQIKFFNNTYIQIFLKKVPKEDSLKIVVDKKFKEIIENSIEGYFEVDLDGNFIFVNDVFAKLWNHSKETILTMNYRDLLNEEDSKKFFDIFNQLYNTGNKIKNFQYKIKTDSNKILFGETSIYLRTDSIGAKIGFNGFVRDISLQKKSQLKLKESEEKFRSIAEQSVLGIVIIQDDLIKYVNNRFAELIGYDLEEIKQWNLKDYEKVWYESHISFILEQIQKKQIGIKDNIYCFQVKYVKKNKELFWVEKILQSINYKGKPAALISVFDITKEKDAENLIMEENKRLKELDLIRKNFLDRASHELKTPLTSVYGASQLLTDLVKNYDSKKQHYINELVQIISEGSEKLTKLIANLLDISKLESNNLKLEKTEIDIVELIKSCIRDIKYLLKKRNHNITKELPKEFKIKIDKARIERVITNILSNAINYTPSGGLIQIILKQIDNNIEITISDNGIGLTKDHIEKMFDKFVHIQKPLEQYDIKLNGTGLGLYISKEIIELHNGNIMVESEGLNKGSTFKFTLPII